MLNYVQPGENLTVAAPENVLAGELFFLGDLALVACDDALSGADVQARRTGVYTFTKTAGGGTAMAAFSRALYDVSADAFAGNATDVLDRNAGIVVEAATDDDTTVKVLINVGSGVLRAAGGVYTQDAGDDTDNVALIDTGLSVILGFSVLLTTSANVANGSDAVITKSGGNISVADGATTYDCTAGFKVTWTAVGY